MHFGFTEEQEAFRESVTRFLAKHAPVEAARAAAESPAGWDPALWARTNDQLGVAALAIPERFGGFGFGWVELAAFAELAGAHLLCSPLLPTAMAVEALIGAGDEAACERWLPAVAAAESTAAVVFPVGAGWRGRPHAVRAEQTPAGWRLTGTRGRVLGAVGATFLVVAAFTDDGEALFVVPSETDGVEVERLTTMDETRRKADVRFDCELPASARLAEDASRARARARQRGAALLAAEHVGGAQRCLDDAVEYAKVREQFGRPIGSFQAIKHKCADMMLRVESARSAARAAAWAIDAAGEGASAAASEAVACAATYCAEAYFFCAAESIQIHGGVGFTWEVDAHMHFKRATNGRSLLGAPDDWREAIAAELLDR